MAELEAGWPERDFDEEAREFLYESTLRSSKELNEVIKQQDTKASVFFGAAVLIAGTGGWALNLRLGVVPVPVLTFAALIAVFAALYFSVRVFEVRHFAAGVHVTTLFGNAHSTRDQLRDDSLDVLAEVYEKTHKVSIDKGHWLRLQLYSVVVEAVLVAAILATR